MSNPEPGLSQHTKFVHVKAKTRRKSAKKRSSQPQREFQAARLDRIWETWILGTLIPFVFVMTSARMAITDYAVLPARHGRWAVYHGIDARLLALAVLAVGFWIHVRGVWPHHRRLEEFIDFGQIAAGALLVIGLFGMLLHQGYLIFQ